MKKINKRIVSIVMTSAILVSGALSCSAICSTNWFYKFTTDVYNDMAHEMRDKEYLKIYWPEGKTVIWTYNTEVEISHYYALFKGRVSVRRVTRNYAIE